MSYADEHARGDDERREQGERGRARAAQKSLSHGKQPFEQGKQLTSCDERAGPEGNRPIFAPGAPTPGVANGGRALSAACPSVRVVALGARPSASPDSHASIGHQDGGRRWAGAFNRPPNGTRLRPGPNPQPAQPKAKRPRKEFAAPAGNLRAIDAACDGGQPRPHPPPPRQRPRHLPRRPRYRRSG